MMSKTTKNLEEAFAGESQANRRYLAFARKADQEGYSQVAKLFRAAAEAETIHAHAHLRVLGGIRTTSENLKEAVAGETHEFKKMYPDMIEEARGEGQDAALKFFSYANEVEKIHAGLYQKALEQMERLESVDYYVCSVCGYTCEGQPPDVCPVCKSKAKAFFKTE
jgi:rubrerythrin